MGSLTDKLKYLLNTKTAIKKALTGKGVEVADTDTFRDYVDKIKTIDGTGVAIINQDRTFTENGDYTVDDGYTGIGNITVNVPLDVAGITASNCFSVDENGKLGTLGNSDVVCTATDLSSYVFYYKWYANPVKSVSFPNLTTISGSYALYRAFYNNITSLASISFPNLKSITGSYTMEDTFAIQTYHYSDQKEILSSVEFPSLMSITGQYAMAGTFYYRSGLNSVSFPVLSNLNGIGVLYKAFSNTQVTSLDLPNLSGTIYSCCFGNNKSLTKIWIPKEVTVIKASNMSTGTDYSYSYSPFYQCSSSLVIYTDATEKLEGWSNYCFNVDSSTEATVVYGATHDEFLAA